MHGLYFPGLPGALEVIHAAGHQPADRLAAAAEVAFASQSMAHALAVLIRYREEVQLDSTESHAAFHTHACNLAVILSGLTGELTEALADAADRIEKASAETAPAAVPKAA
jgi:hypothetical protein